MRRRVLQLLDGEPLDRRFQRLGALSIEDSLRICRHVASAIGAAHVRGIIHRDQFGWREVEYYKDRSGPGRRYLASPLTVAASAVVVEIVEHADGMFESPPKP